ncbi:hypothetical protein [Desulforamulus ruminis]|nr:hypothetical protein [Desulforamulus ruminis]
MDLPVFIFPKKETGERNMPREIVGFLVNNFEAVAKLLTAIIVLITEYVKTKKPEKPKKNKRR